MPQPHDSKPSIPASLADYHTVTRLLTNLAYAEDTLDWKLFESCYTTTQPLQIDLSTHLSTYSPNLTMSVSDLARTAHHQLSGFDSTQHVISNITVDVNAHAPETATRAFARAYVTAFHEFKRPVIEGPGFVLVRGMWNMNLMRGESGEWRIDGVKITRMTGVEGDEALYDLAKVKGESGKGRVALTSWSE